jgi:signal transduction histidine kinase
MKQVFINLMKNAIEAMPGGGKLLIQVKKKQELAVIRFIDQGCGIPKEKLKQIGSPFYSTKEDGNGLGLMVSYNIIENHHGKIHIESEIGVGSTFTVSLPIYTPSRLHPAFH